MMRDSPFNLDGTWLADPVRVAQAAFVQLAIRVARQRGHEVNAPGELVAGNSPPQELEQLGLHLLVTFTRPVVRQELDDRLNLLAPLGVWNTKDRDIRHTR